MNLLQRFRPICVQDTENQPFEDMLEVALNRRALLNEGAFKVVLDLLLRHVLIVVDRLIVYYFAIFYR